MSARYQAALQVNKKKLKFLPDKQKRKRRRRRHVEPMLLQYLNECLMEWKLRGGPSEVLVDQVLRSFDRKFNDLKFDVPTKEDSRRVVDARQCPEMDWVKTVAHNLRGGYQEHICVLLVPMPLKNTEDQVVQTHIPGQFLVRNINSEAIDASVLLKQLHSLTKLALPDVPTFKCCSFIEIVGINGFTFHLYPVVSRLLSGSSINFITLSTPNRFQHLGQEMGEQWLCPSGGSTWCPLSLHSGPEEHSESFIRGVILLAELRLAHSLALSLEDVVAIVASVWGEGGEEKRLPIHHIFTLSLRLLTHVLQSSRVIRKAGTGEVALRKLVFGRCDKYDARVRDILKVCMMFNRMEECEEYEGLLPPPDTNSFNDMGSASESEVSDISD